MSDPRDRELGMGRRITRRDFLNGVKLAVGGSILASNSAWLYGWEERQPGFAAEQNPDYYPPALMGMRGNHDGTYT